MSGSVSLFGFGPDSLDDTELIKAYDRARRLTKSEAKDSQSNKTVIITDPPGDWTQVSRNYESKSKPGTINYHTIEQPVATTTGESSNSLWKVGEHCRAVYYEDGLQYEAEITVIGNDSSYVIIRFLGYENEQEVQLSDLSKSLGRKARRTQIRLATQTTKTNSLGVEDDDNGEALESSFSNLKIRDDASSEESNFAKQETHHTSRSQASSSKGTMDWKQAFPNVLMPPFPSGFGGFEKGEIPSLLMSWYMSGYQAGYFDAKRDLRNPE